MVEFLQYALFTKEGRPNSKSLCDRCTPVICDKCEPGHLTC